VKTGFSAKRLFRKGLRSGLIAASLFVLVFLVARYGIMPHFRHAVPQGMPRGDQSDQKVQLEFRPLLWQEVLQTSTPQMFVIRKPRGLIVSNAPESTFAPQETFEPDAIHAREDSAITLGTSFRPYFGNLHTHTGWSDGKGDPATAFAHARDVAHLDFMAVTDHPEFWLFDQDRNWRDLKDIAKVFTSSTFVALAGFEYSSPAFGHYTVIESNSVCSAFKCARLSQFYDWLSGPGGEGAVVFFSHPLQQKDNATAYEFAQFRPHPGAMKKMAGIEVIHWGGYRHFLDGFSGTQPFIDEALELGWRLGSVSAQDNHGFNWGSGGTNRMVLLLNHLSRESVMEALVQRRFYATSSRLLQFTAQAQLGDGSWLQMGEETETRKLPAGDIMLVARFFEPDVDQIPHRFEWIVNGRIVGDFDFYERSDMREYMDSKQYYAGELKLELPRHLLREERLNYIYARFYQRDSLDPFTQSSPIFFRGSNYQPPAYAGPKESW